MPHPRVAAAMRLNAILAPMPDRPHLELIFLNAESSFGLGELDIDSTVPSAAGLGHDHPLSAARRDYDFSLVVVRRVEDERRVPIRRAGDLAVSPVSDGKALESQRLFRWRQESEFAQFPNAFSSGLSVLEQERKDPKAVDEILSVVDALYTQEVGNDYQDAAHRKAG
jgi:hypothetical protein